MSANDSENTHDAAANSDCSPAPCSSSVPWWAWLFIVPAGPLPQMVPHPIHAMKTDEANLQAAQVLKQDHILRSRLERVRSRMQTHIADVKREIDSLSEALIVEYTGHVALLKQTPAGWTCLACVNSRNPPPDTPEDFDLCLPIPKPETMPEWKGW